MHLSTSPETASSGDVKLSYTIYPDQQQIIDPQKKPLIFPHGLFGAKGNLHSVSKLLAADGRKVITYDARNHGDSQHSPKMDYVCMAEDLVRMLTDLNLSGPVVMGHSMGGKTAMTLSLTKPDKMAALIVADVTPSTSSGIEELKKYAEAMKQVKFTPGSNLPQARQQAQSQLSSVVTNRSVLQFLLTNLRQLDGGEVQWRNNLDAFLNNIKEIETFPAPINNQFQKPTLFVFGANSIHYREHDPAKIKTLFPKAEISVIKNAGHFVHADQPAEFVRVVKQFLQTVDSSSS